MDHQDHLLAPSALDRSLYAYIWTTSRPKQIHICLLIALVAPLTMVPLELQRRIVDRVITGHDLRLLVVLGSVYLGVTLLQGGLKYMLNLSKGRVLEEVARDLRRRILAREHRSDEGTTTSILAAESDDIGGFASDSLAVPLLQVGTIAWVIGYLLWVEPLIAALALAVYAPQLVLVPRIQGAINRLARERVSAVRRLGRDAVNADAATGTERERLRAHADQLVERILGIRMRIYRRKFFLTFLGNLLDSLGPIIVVTVGGYLVMQGRAEISALVVFISGFQKLSDPWDQLVTFYRSVSNARVAWGLVFDALGGPGAGREGSA